MEPFEASLPPDLARLRKLRQDLAEWLASVHVPQGRRDAIVLAIHEAAANAIEHACSRVTIKGARDQDKLILVVANSGRWGGPRSEDLWRGRGLTLMQALTSQLEIHAEAGRTTVRMRVDLGDSRARSAT
jgi:anti-sigma regulatory factor (Ser/Thr protein kinase)